MFVHQAICNATQRKWKEKYIVAGIFRLNFATIFSSSTLYKIIIKFLVCSENCILSLKILNLCRCYNRHIILVSLKAKSESCVCKWMFRVPTIAIDNVISQRTKNQYAHAYADKIFQSTCKRFSSILEEILHSWRLKF